MKITYHKMVRIEFDSRKRLNVASIDSSSESELLIEATDKKRQSQRFTYVNLRQIRQS